METEKTDVAPLATEASEIRVAHLMASASFIYPETVEVMARPSYVRVDLVPLDPDDPGARVWPRHVVPRFALAIGTVDEVLADQRHWMLKGLQHMLAGEAVAKAIPAHLAALERAGIPETAHWLPPANPKYTRADAQTVLEETASAVKHLVAWDTEAKLKLAMDFVDRYVLNEHWETFLTQAVELEQAAAGWPDRETE